MSTPAIDKDTAASQALQEAIVEPKVARRRIIGLLAGVVLAVVIFLIMPQNSADLASQAANATLPSDTAADKLFAFDLTGLKLVAAIAVLMAAWWMTEAIPLAATALIPIALFPVLKICSFADAGKHYASGTIFLFMGGFMIALAMQRWNLHRRIALAVVKVVGVKPKRLILGFMIATGFISMWVSNTATAVMMLPIGLSILHLVGQITPGKQATDSRFGTALMLGIAYAASIGSLSTLIGTPPNMLLKGYLAEHGIDLNFGRWMLAGLPLSIVFLGLTWFLLTNVFYKPEIKEIPGGKELIDHEIKAMGPMSTGEKLVGIVFVLAAVSWIVIPGFLPSWGIKDEMIAMCAGLILFILPVSPTKGLTVLDWKTAKQIPWDVLLLFGGGLALSGQFEATGLSYWIGEQAKHLGGLPTVLLIVAFAGLVLFLTELTSNTATAAVFIPIVGGVAVGLQPGNANFVMVLTIPVALAATCAFMLPVATPPNAIAYGSGYVKIGQMIRAGIGLNIIGMVLVTIAMYALFIPILGIVM